MTEPCYVYSYSTEKDGVFYIGKGTGNRIGRISAHNQWVQNVFSKRKAQGIEVLKSKIYTNMEEQQAFAWEKYLIKFYQPKCNFTNGGEGASGHKHTKETKRKMSKSRPEETRQKMSKAHMGRIFSEETKQKIGKANSGENCANAKLTWPEVREIRKKWNSGNYTQQQLGNESSVDQTTIFKIVNNKTWIKK